MMDSTQPQPLTAEELCPRCDGPMERVVIDGHDSWACPKDAYAYAVDQSDDFADYLE